MTKLWVPISCWAYYCFKVVSSIMCHDRQFGQRFSTTPLYTYVWFLKLKKKKTLTENILVQISRASLVSYSNLQQ